MYVHDLPATLLESLGPLCGLMAIFRVVQHPEPGLFVAAPTCSERLPGAGSGASRLFQRRILHRPWGDGSVMPGWCNGRHTLLKNGFMSVQIRLWAQLWASFVMSASPYLAVNQDSTERRGFNSLLAHPLESTSQGVTSVWNTEGGLPPAGFDPRVLRHLGAARGAGWPPKPTLLGSNPRAPAIWKACGPGVHRSLLKRCALWAGGFEPLAFRHGRRVG